MVWVASSTTAKFPFPSVVSSMRYRPTYFSFRMLPHEVFSRISKITWSVFFCFKHISRCDCHFLALSRNTCVNIGAVIRVLNIHATRVFIDACANNGTNCYVMCVIMLRPCNLSAYFASARGVSIRSRGAKVLNLAPLIIRDKKINRFYHINNWIFTTNLQCWTFTIFLLKCGICLTLVNFQIIKRDILSLSLKQFTDLYYFLVPANFHKNSRITCLTRSYKMINMVVESVPITITKFEYIVWKTISVMAVTISLCFQWVTFMEIDGQKVSAEKWGYVKNVTKCFEEGAANKVLTRQFSIQTSDVSDGQLGW